MTPCLRDALALASVIVGLGCGSDDRGGTVGDTGTNASDGEVTDGASETSGFAFEYVAIWGKGGIGGEQIHGAGSGPGEFDYPAGLGLAPDESEVYVFDSGNRRIVAMSPSGEFLRSWPAPPQKNCEESPEPLGVGPDGTVYISEHATHGVIGYSPTGEVRNSWPLHAVGSLCGTIMHPHMFAFDHVGNVYVTEYSLREIQVFTSDGTYTRSIGTAEPGKGFTEGPNGVVWADGLIYASDNDRILIYRDTGEFVRPIFAGSAADHINGITSELATWNGWFFVWKAADDPELFAQATSVMGLTKVWQTVRGLALMEMRQPYQVAIDTRGRWYISEYFNSRIQVLDMVLSKP